MKLDEWQIQSLLRDHFEFYEDLRLKRPRPKSAAQRQFLDVAWGKVNPKTEHEHAYVAYLPKHGIGAFASMKDKPHIDDVMTDDPVGHRRSLALSAKNGTTPGAATAATRSSDRM